MIVGCPRALSSARVPSCVPPAGRFEPTPALGSLAAIAVEFTLEGSVENGGEQSVQLDGSFRLCESQLFDFGLMFTGVRRGEALGFAWENVDRARGVVVLVKFKNGKPRDVQLSRNADAA